MGDAFQHGGVPSNAGIWKPAGYFQQDTSGNAFGPGSAWKDLSNGPDQVSGIVVPANGLLAVTYRAEIALAGGTISWAGAVRMLIDWGDGVGFRTVRTPGTTGDVVNNSVPVESQGVKVYYTDGASILQGTADPPAGYPAGTPRAIGTPLFIFGRSTDRTATVKFDYNPDYNANGSQQIYALNRLITCWTCGVTT